MTTLYGPDAFTDTNGTALPSYNAAWVSNAGDWKINASNQATATVDDSLAHVNGGFSWVTSQWAQCTIVTAGSGGGHGTGPAVNCASSGDTGYVAYATTAASRIYLVNGGSFSQIANNAGVTFANGDIAYLENNAGTLTLKKGGAAGTTGTSVADATLSNGFPGIEWGAGGDTYAVDDFSAGDFSSGGGDVSVSLTGQGLTSARGTLTPATSKALSGSALTSSQGTLTPAGSKALSGQALTGAQTAPTPDLSIALTGQALSFGQGTLTATQGDVSVVLTGQAITSALGTLAPDAQVALAGSALTGAQGTVTAVTGITVALTGQAMSLSQGTLTSDISALLDGQSILIAQGRLAPPSQAEEITGGGYFLTAYDRELIRRRREKKRREELEEESRTLQDQIEREIAILLRRQEEEDARQAELQRLRTLVREHANRKLDTELSERALVAYTRVLAQENFSALEALERELSRQIEEEDHAILMMLLSD